MSAKRAIDELGKGLRLPVTVIIGLCNNKTDISCSASALFDIIESHPDSPLCTCLSKYIRRR